MHKFLTDWPKTDHIDGNGLNNQRRNLRPCTTAQNAANQTQQKGRSSLYKGVSWRKGRNKWRAGIKVNGKQINLGDFTNETEAALAYNKAAAEHFKEFARLNTVPKRPESVQIGHLGEEIA